MSDLQLLSRLVHPSKLFAQLDKLKVQAVVRTTFAVELAAALYCLCVVQADWLHLLEGSHKSEEPESTQMVKFTGGVPSCMLP